MKYDVFRQNADFFLGIELISLKYIVYLCLSGREGKGMMSMIGGYVFESEE